MICEIWAASRKVECPIRDTNFWISHSLFRFVITIFWKKILHFIAQIYPWVKWFPRSSTRLLKMHQLILSVLWESWLIKTRLGKDDAAPFQIYYSIPTSNLNSWYIHTYPFSCQVYIVLLLIPNLPTVLLTKASNSVY